MDPKIQICAQNSSTGTMSSLKRYKANARERNRMHGLNQALDRLRSCIPLNQNQSLRSQKNFKAQKLSKIETLRLARNYLILLTEILYSHDDSDFYNENETIGQILAFGLGQQSLNQLAIQLNLPTTRKIAEPSNNVRRIFARYQVNCNYHYHSNSLIKPTTQFSNEQNYNFNNPTINLHL